MGGVGVEGGRENLAGDEVSQKGMAKTPAVGR